MGDFSFWLRLSLSQFAERNLKLNARVSYLDQSSTKLRTLQKIIRNKPGNK